MSDCPPEAAMEVNRLPTPKGGEKEGWKEGRKENRGSLQARAMTCTTLRIILSKKW
jgi:hypothetical protein